MPRVRFELTIPVLERAKTLGVLDRAATVIGTLILVQIFVISVTSKSALGTTQRLVKRVLGINGPRREINQSPPSSAEVKNCGAIPPLPVRCDDVLHKAGVRRPSRDQRFAQLPCS
jgi:hypothetical protein